MILADSLQQAGRLDTMAPFAVLPPVFETELDHKRHGLLAALSPDTPWGDRQSAARQLGNMRDREALPGLLGALPTDPFWMVRCAIIQALEKIDDPSAIPVLQQVAENDGFQMVRQYAAAAVNRLAR